MTDTSARRFLFCLWEGGGTGPPELGLARRLVDEGHQVLVLGDATMADASTATGAEFRSWSDPISRQTLTREDDPVRDWEAKSPPAAFDALTKNLIGEPATYYCADVLAAVADWKPDAAAVDSFLFGALIGCEEAGIPTASLVPNIYPWPRDGVPPVGPGLRPKDGLVGRVRDKAMGVMATKLWSKALPSIERLRAERGLPAVDSIFDQAIRADRILVLTSEEFDLPGPAPDHVRWVGPILDDPDWTEPWVSPWPADDDRPLVLVSLSSTFQDQAGVIERVIEALDSMNVRGLITLGPILDPTDFEGADNVMVVASAPHAEVIPQASLVITHCGHGTTIKALAAGVPMVCLPMGRDQNDTAVRVVEAGAGIRLKNSAKPPKIAKAATAVLDDPGYRVAAEQLSAAIGAPAAKHAAVTELEQLAQAGRREATEPRTAAC